MYHLLNSHPGSEKIDSFGNEVRNDSSEIDDFETHFSLRIVTGIRNTGPTFTRLENCPFSIFSNLMKIGKIFGG